MKKLVLFLAFATAMIFTMVLFNAGAAQVGTPVGSIAEFEAMAVVEGSLESPAVVKDYYLTNDIDFEGKSYNDYIIDHFSGTLDGNGYKIHNFSLVGTAGDTAIIQRGSRDGNTVIKDLVIGTAEKPIKLTENSGSVSIGILFGAIGNSDDINALTCTISDVTIYGDIDITNSVKGNCGGFMGYCRRTTFTNCKMYGTIDFGNKEMTGTSYMNAGGICGTVHSNNVTFTGCENYADITVVMSSTEARAAGILAYGDSSLVFTDCKNYGTLSAPEYDGEYGYYPSDSYVGGIQGHMNKNSSTFINCENHGQIISMGTIGQIIANVTPSSIADGDTALTIKDCKGDGKMTSNPRACNTTELVNRLYGVEVDAKYVVVIENSTVTLQETDLIEYTTVYREPKPQDPDEDDDDDDEDDNDDVTTTKPTTTTKAIVTTAEEVTKKKSCGGIASIAAVLAVACGAFGVAIIKKN